MSLQDDIEDYWTRRGNGFSDAVNDEFENSTNELREIIIEQLGIQPGMKVLDIGCGPGYFEMILQDSGAQLYAIDYSQGMVENAIKNVGQQGIHAEIKRMDAQALDYPDGMFDAIISRNVLWSLVKPWDAYSEMLRVMKPGAKALVIDGNFYLRLFNKDYDVKMPPREVHEDEGAGSHSKFNKDNVDFNEMTELAKSLPLSREVRPKWDFDVLSEMPCSNINVSMRARKSDDGVRRIGMFTITFTKEVN